MNSSATCSAPSIRLAGLLFLSLVPIDLLHAGDTSGIKWLVGGHSREVNSVAFSPDGSILASASDDFTIKFWSVADRTMVRTLVGHTEDVRSAAFSSDGSLLVSASQDATIRIWRVADGTLLRSIADGSGVRQAVFTPDGTVLVSGNEAGIVRIRRASDWAITRSIELPMGVEAIAVSPDGATLAVATAVPSNMIVGDVARITVWRISDGVRRFALGSKTNFVRSLAYSPDGQWLASSGSPSSAQSQGLQGRGVVDLWRLVDGALATNLLGHTAQVRSVAFTRDSQLLASASFDSTVKLWDPRNGTLLGTLTNDMPEHTLRETEMRAVAFAPNGQLLATGDKSDRVKLWRIPDGSLHSVLTSHSGPIVSVALSANGQYMATGARGHDDSAKLWRVRDRVLFHTIPGFSDFGGSVALSPDGALLAMSGFDFTNPTIRLKLWKTADGTLVRALNARGGPSGALAFSFDGTRLVSANPDATLDLWDVASGTLLWTSSNLTFYAVAWSPDGSLLATASGTHPWIQDHSVALWRASDGRLLRLLNQNENPVPALAFSPDGATVATGGSEFITGGSSRFVMKLWRVSDGALIRVLRGQTSDTVGVAFSSDSQILASANTDNTLRFWRVSDGALLHTVQEEMSNLAALGATAEYMALGRLDATAVLMDWPVIFTRAELLPDQRLALEWNGGKGLYQLQVRTNFTVDTWRNLGSRQGINSSTNPIQGPASFFRVLGHAE